MSDIGKALTVGISSAFITIGLTYAGVDQITATLIGITGILYALCIVRFSKSIHKE